MERGGRGRALPLPRISIVVPNYNGGATLERTVRSLLAQEYPDLQIILMDSASKDNSIEIIERYRHNFDPCIVEKDKGQADGLNRGFRQARGEIRAWLCSDDELTPGTLHHVAEVFENNPQANLLIGHCERVFSDGKSYVVTPNEKSWENINVQNGLDQPSLFWRAELQQKAGELDPTYNLAFDWDLWNRFKKSGARPVFTDRVLSRYYFSETNKSGNSGSQHAREAFRILRKYGPIGGMLGYIFRFLYRHFDLKGCYDKPPTCTLWRSHVFMWVLAALMPLIGRRRLYQYNWHFASCQERGLKWW
ncbi:MAG TPA: glycosyltransferase family 2 protein [Tepidisphaeraceae bacterium]|jgi:glycosyltransferase involved in cell wall biosynthesis|nr:glycosyltransferase family 2 protein [Tepidisphaeraceae bacterium]